MLKIKKNHTLRFCRATCDRLVEPLGRTRDFVGLAGHRGGVGCGRRLSPALFDPVGTTVATGLTAGVKASRNVADDVLAGAVGAGENPPPE